MTTDPTQPEIGPQNAAERFGLTEAGREELEVLIVDSGFPSRGAEVWLIAGRISDAIEHWHTAHVTAALAEVERRIERWRDMAEWAAEHAESRDRAQISNVRALAYHRSARIIRDYRQEQR